MNMNHNKRKIHRGGPPNSGRNRMRGPLDSKILSEGVYSNPRFTHAATTLIGCVIQVEVKNGARYEGIFRTISSKMCIVLESAHLVDNNNQKQIPSRERIVDKYIFELRDIVMISARNVELDYANKDTFTDAAISGSKYNGQIFEKELQPWMGEDDTGGNKDGGIEAEAANGWDPNEMFKTNAEKFNINSSYDPSLSQYTTPLQPQNTKEYKKREAEALKLAHEIEKSEVYKARVELENGDGDEEDKFSAVARPGESNSHSVGGKYVPPHQRKTPNQGRAVLRTNNVNNVPSPQISKTPSPVTDDREIPAVNGEKEDKPMETNVETPVVPQENTLNSLASPESKGSESPRDLPTTPPGKIARERQIEDLKEFSNKFKLSEKDKEKKDRSTEELSSEEKTNTVEEKADEPVKITDIVKNSTLNPTAKEFVFNPKSFQPKQNMPPQNPTPPRPHTQSPIINIPSHPMQVQYINSPYNVPMTQTHQPPPRIKRAVVSVQPRQEFNAAQVTGVPLTALPNQPGQYPVQYVHQSVVPGSHVPPGVFPQMAQMRMIGAQGMQQPHMIPGPHIGNEGASQQGGQPGPNTPTGAPVYVPSQPGSAAVPAHMAPHQGATVSHQQLAHVQPAPVHMAPHHQPTPPHSQPSHIVGQPNANPGHHPAPSPVHQHPHQHQHNHPGGAVPNAQAPPHPPNSGTPQPHIMYQQPNPGQMAPPQAGVATHPQLQPSPHTPTSPQTMHPPTYPYTYNTQSAGNPMHAAPPGVAGQQMTFAHNHPTPTHAQHQHAHSPQQPQIIMMSQMPQPPNHTGGPHHQVPQGAQFQGHHISGHGPVAGQPHMVPHSGMGTINVSSASNSYQQMHPYMHPAHPQITFTVPSQGHPQPVQTYPYNQ